MKEEAWYKWYISSRLIGNYIVLNDQYTVLVLAFQIINVLNSQNIEVRLAVILLRLFIDIEYLFILS